MKRIFILFLALIPYLAIGQDCSFYFPYEKGTTTETKSFDKKGIHIGTNTLTVLDYATAGGVTTIKTSSTYKPVAGGDEYTSEYVYTCEGGQFYVDMKGYLDNGSMTAYKDMQIEVEADKLAIPADLKAGQTLEGGKVIAKITNNGMKVMEMNVEVKDRKVEAIETIKTEAGSFECYKITQNISSKMGFVKVEASSIEWLSKEVGIVKSESYSKKGKIQGYSEISKITKP